jgi:hypothetical protein
LFPSGFLQRPRPAKQSIQPSIQLLLLVARTVAFGGQNESGFLLATSQGIHFFSARFTEEQHRAQGGQGLR